MNKVILLGNLTAKPELRYTTSEKIPVANFTIAVKRDYKNADGDYATDFISCSAFRKTGELIAEHFEKGSKILVTGNIRIENYENEKGEKKQATRINVEQFDFVGTKKLETPKEEKVVNDPFAEYGEQIEITDDILD